MSNPSTDSIGNQIISKHAPFFKPGDMAAAIDEAINREKAALLDEGKKVYKTYGEEMLVNWLLNRHGEAQRAKLTKEDK